MTKTALVWFRRDLRTTDQPALSAAAKATGPILALYILDDNPFSKRKRGAASRWWLHHSLESLRTDLMALDIPLLLLRGDATAVVPEIAAKSNVDTVYCSHVHEPSERQLEIEVASGLAAAGRKLSCHEGGLIHPPGNVTNKEGQPYRVFTPYWKTWYNVPPPRPIGKIARRGVRPVGISKNISLQDLSLLPKHPDWSVGLRRTWQPGELGAEAQLTRFNKGIGGSYECTRDLPATTGTSRLSAHLHFGEISPARVWHSVKASTEANKNSEVLGDISKFLRQLCWRDFNHDLLARYPNMERRNIDARFDKFSWRTDDKQLIAWQQGRTGYPIVDAGMRELWATGWMHNRVRMIAASFLTKHLLINWHAGEEWFWDTLVDADIANNGANWQWIAGSGMDAAPYFRIFNPILQGQRFDPAGDYVRKWVPERANYSAKQIHIPSPPKEGLFADGYPSAIVDHKAARQRALEAYRATKSKN